MFEGFALEKGRSFFYGLRVQSTKDATNRQSCRLVAPIPKAAERLWTVYAWDAHPVCGTGKTS
jgi:hypothetical protein